MSRTLSDQDVEVIVDRLMEKVFERAQREAGKSVIAYFRKLLSGAFIAFVLYSAAKYGGHQ